MIFTTLFFYNSPQFSPVFSVFKTGFLKYFVSNGYKQNHFFPN